MLCIRLETFLKYFPWKINFPSLRRPRYYYTIKYSYVKKALLNCARIEIKFANASYRIAKTISSDDDKMVFRFSETV